MATWNSKSAGTSLFNDEDPLLDPFAPTRGLNAHTAPPNPPVLAFGGASPK